MLDKLSEISLLYDFYGNLLPERQKDFLRLYHEENYTLSEIADEFSLSRQGVYDGVKKAERSLYTYEEKLGLLKRFQDREAVLKDIHTAVEQLAEEYKDNEELKDKLAHIMSRAEQLGE